MGPSKACLQAAAFRKVAGPLTHYQGKYTTPPFTLRGLTPPTATELTEAGVLDRHCIADADGRENSSRNRKVTRGQWRTQEDQGELRGTWGNLGFHFLPEKNPTLSHPKY